MTANSQILHASLLGTRAFANGINASCQDANIMQMIKQLGRQIGETPVNQASTIDILGAWNHAWHAANSAN